MDNSKKGLPSNECRAPGHRHRRGDRYLAAGDANAVIGTAVSFFTSTEGSLSMQPREQVDTGVDVGSNELL